jgi:Major Facilitator Superfamily
MSQREETPLLEQEEDLDRQDESKNGWSLSGPSIYTIVTPYTVISIAMLMLAPVEMNWALTIVCNNHFGEDLSYSDARCQSPEVQAETSKYVSAFALIGGLVSLYSMPYFCGLSDRYGRLPFMKLFVVGHGLQVLLMVLILINWQKSSIVLMIIPYILSGLLCGPAQSPMVIPLVSSYIGDAVGTPHRTTAMSLMQSANMIGKAVGPFLSGWLLKRNLGITNAMLGAVIIDVIALLTLYVYTPESLTEIAREQAEAHHEARLNQDHGLPQWRVWLRRANILNPVYRLYELTSHQSPKAKRNIFILLAMELLYQIVISSRAGLAVLYPEMKFGWTATDVGYLQSSTAVYRIIVLTVVSPLAIKALQSYYRETRVTTTVSSTDTFILRVGNLMESGGYMGYGLAHNGFQYAVSYFVSTTGVVAKVAVSTALLNLAPAGTLGIFLGAKGVLESVSGVIFSSAGLQLYSYTVARWPELLFFICSAGYFTVVIMSCFLIIH